jgi:hypothetical protein
LLHEVEETLGTDDVTDTEMDVKYGDYSLISTTFRAMIQATLRRGGSDCLPSFSTGRSG